MRGNSLTFVAVGRMFSAHAGRNARPPTGVPGTTGQTPARTKTTSETNAKILTGRLVATVANGSPAANEPGFLIAAGSPIGCYNRFTVSPYRARAQRPNGTRQAIGKQKGNFRPCRGIPLFVCSRRTAKRWNIRDSVSMMNALIAAGRMFITTPNAIKCLRIGQSPCALKGMCRRHHTRRNPKNRHCAADHGANMSRLHRHN